MNVNTLLENEEDILFPGSDGKPMADNTEQYRWIVLIKENLELIFADRPDVFVAADLLWYPVKSRDVASTAPDVMVVFGRPKGKRGSYRQWREDGIAPQVVVEILSPNNSREEMSTKYLFFEHYGVEEYYLYDPELDELRGWLRQHEQLLPIANLDGWVSPRLGIRFETKGVEMTVYRPDGQKFKTLQDVEGQLERERQRSERLAKYLRTLHIDPESIDEESSDGESS